MVAPRCGIDWVADERLKLQFEAVSKLDEKEREAVETMIAGRRASR